MSRSAHPAGPRHAELVESTQLAGPLADAAELEAGVWPATCRRDATGALELGGRRIPDLAAVYGTPLFVLDEADLRSRASAWAGAFEAGTASGEVYFAAKAFWCIWVARTVVAEGLGVDICTGGELAVAQRAGVDLTRAVFHGNNKTVPELEQAVAAGVGRIVVDSFVEIERVADVAAQAGKTVDVLVRVTVGVEAHTHEFIATAHEDQKFGFSLAGGQAMAAVDAVLARAGQLRLVGLHSHIGSQIFDTDGFEVAAHRLVGLAVEVKKRHGIVPAELNLGGGLGIAYVASDDPPAVADIAGRLRAIVVAECSVAGLPVPLISVEPGRAIVGPTTITVYQVGTVKPVRVGRDGGPGGIRHYISVDGGMSDNIRTALYDAAYTVTLANRVSSAMPVLARVVGKHCESGDIVVRDTWLPGDITPGDLLAVAATGAYCRSMASQYNHQPRAGVVAVVDGAAHVVLRRETLDDLLALDVG